MAGFSDQRRYVCLGFDRRKESLRKLNTPRSFEKKKITESGWRLTRTQPSKAFQNRLLWRCGGGVEVKYRFSFIVSS